MTPSFYPHLVRDRDDGKVFAWGGPAHDVIIFRDRDTFADYAHLNSRINWSWTAEFDPPHDATYTEVRDAFADLVAAWKTPEEEAAQDDPENGEAVSDAEYHASVAAWLVLHRRTELIDAGLAAHDVVDQMLENGHSIGALATAHSLDVGAAADRAIAQLKDQARAEERRKILDETLRHITIPTEATTSVTVDTVNANAINTLLDRHRDFTGPAATPTKARKVIPVPDM